MNGSIEEAMDSSAACGSRHLKGLIREARVYREQGLLAQSRDRYLEAIEALELDCFDDRSALRASLQEAVDRVEQEIDEVDRADEPPELSGDTTLWTSTWRRHERRERRSFRARRTKRSEHRRSNGFGYGNMWGFS